MPSRNDVEQRLIEVGVRPTDADLEDIVAGWPTLVEWYRIVDDMLESETGPAVVFTLDVLGISAAPSDE